MIKKLILVIFFIFFSFSRVSAQQQLEPEILEGEVIKIIDFGQQSVLDELVPYQELLFKVNRGSIAGQEVKIKNINGITGLGNIDWKQYAKGDKLRVNYAQDFESNYQFNILGQVKRQTLLVLVIIFIFCVLLVGRVWGLLSLIGMGISFLVIFKVILPLIISGFNPVLAALLGSILIIPGTFYISHGFNIKTHVGVISTSIILIFTALMAMYFVSEVHLTGFASEEAGFIQVEQQGKINILGLLIAGIIIGALGVLDDITVGQASVVEQLKKSNPKIELFELFNQGMKVGQDHVSSMVNTLILVYAGSSLPLLLLFFDANQNYINIIELEIIAEEIVRMMVGSIGLVLAAPLATLMAAAFFSKKKN